MTQIHSKVNRDSDEILNNIEARLINRRRTDM